MKSLNKRLDRTTTIVKDPIYYHDMMICIGDEEFYKKTTKGIDGAGNPEIYNQQGFSTVVERSSGGHYTYIWLRSFSWKVTDYSTLAHEILHASFNVLNSAGIKMDFENQEAGAYYFDYLYSTAIRQLLKKWNRRNK